MSDCPQASFFLFIWYIISLRCLDKAINKMCNRLQTSNFWMRFFWKRIYVLRERAPISAFLSNKDNDLTYIQHNFNKLHGHYQTVNNYDSKSPMWTYLHLGLKSSLLSSDQVKKIMKKHSPILYSHPLKFRVDERLEEFLLHVWAEFSYGDQINYYEYRDCRNSIVDLLKNHFHNSYLTKIPLIGSLYSLYVYWRIRSIRSKLNKSLQKLITISIMSKKGFIYNFYNWLRDPLNEKKYGVNIQNIQQNLIDNSFLLFLVVDFVHKVLLDYLLRVSVEKKNNKEVNLDQLFKMSLSNGFLYPYRYRWVNSDHDLGGILLNRGDFIIFDLKESHLYFSSGPRSCIGQGLVRSAFYDFVNNDILKYYYLDLDCDDIKYEKHSVNIPVLKHKHIGRWISIKRSDQELTNQMRCYGGHMGVNKYYNVLNLYNDINTFNYIVDDITNNLVDVIDSVDGIVTIETRGLSLAGALSYKLQLPLFTVRKQGKLPGEVFTEKYQTAYSIDVVELCKDDDIKGKRVIIVDDGIATGGTSYACIKLIEQAGGTVAKLVTMVNHTYKPRIDDYQKYNSLTYSSFSLPSF